MPYIKQDSRPRFSEYINNTVLLIMRNSVPAFVRAEYFGFFVDRMCSNFLMAINNTSPFNATNFSAATRKGLEDYASRVSTYIGKDDPMGSSGDLNYVITAVWRGIVGDHAELSPANYGFRTVTRGMIEQILSGLNSTRFVTSDALGSVMNLRRVITLRGVLNDVIDEMYRKRTADYEDQKVAENGDIWEDGKLVLPTPKTAVVPV